MDSLTAAELVEIGAVARRVARSVLHDDFRAEDVGQEIAARALVHEDLLAGAPAPVQRAWARTAGYRYALDTLSRDDLERFDLLGSAPRGGEEATKRERLLVGRRQKQARLAHELLREATPAYLDPQEQVEHGVLQEMLAWLTPRQREVMVLFYFKDVPLAAIAEEMGISLGTVKQHLSRGLVTLRLHYQKHDHD